MAESACFMFAAVLKTSNDQVYIYIYIYIYPNLLLLACLMFAAVIKASDHQVCS